MPEFTQDQLSAIEYREVDACVTAGPGAGKTTVLVERYYRLVAEHGFQPHQILAITFTEKAAANMKAKLAEKFAREPERLRDLESAWVSTIHGFCARLLRENAIAAGLDPRFTVLSPREAENLQWECVNAALDELTKNRREETLELIEALQSPDLAKELKDVYDAIRSAGLTIEAVRDMPNPAGANLAPREITAELREILRAWPGGLSLVQKEEKARLLEWCVEFEAAGDMDFATFLGLKGRLKVNLQRVPQSSKGRLKEFRELGRATAAAVDRHAARFRALIFGVMARFDEEYRNRRNQAGRVDFNDLERHTIALLKNDPAVRARVHRQFRQIMLDEFQDINEQQSDLVSLVRSDNVFFGVGDRNQSIYGFRHARPEIFQQYREEVGLRCGQQENLLHNFRSREAILRCVREVLTGAGGIEDRELIAAGKFVRKDEPSIEAMAIGDEADDKDDARAREAAWIAHRIEALAGTLQLGEPGETRTADFRDFAVLCRARDSMPEILGAFDRAGIPYVCGRRQSFLLSREGLDLTALLRTIANPRDSIALATVLRSPLAGVSDEALLALRLAAGSLTGGLNAFAHAPAAIAEPDASRIAAFRAKLSRWRRDQPLIPLDVLLSRALSECGVSWSANIERFLQLARSAGAAMELAAFLHELEDLTGADDMDSELSDEDQGNCVQVMTAHAAKGLEFPVVVIAAMEKGARPESRPVTFTREHGLGVKWRNPQAKDGKDGLKDSWAEQNKTVLKTREAHEENRLLYVAMTRAEEHLILSWSALRGKATNWAALIEERRNALGGSVLVTSADPPPPTRGALDRADADVETVARPAIDDWHETSVTVTSLALFGACPRKYYIQRSLGWNTGRFRRFDPDSIDATSDDDDEAELPASRIGSAVHEILAGVAPREESVEAKRLADVFFRGELGRRVGAATRTAREWVFIAEMEGTLVRGAIDLWFEENGAIHVVDYKTDDVSAAEAAARAAEYRPQLALYAVALERALGVRPKVAWLHFLRPDMVVEVALDDGTVASALALIGALRTAQDELRFGLNEGEHCRACAFYRSLCPAGRTADNEAEPA